MSRIHRQPLEQTLDSEGTFGGAERGWSSEGADSGREPKPESGLATMLGSEPVSEFPEHAVEAKSESGSAEAYADDESPLELEPVLESARSSQPAASTRTSTSSFYPRVRFLPILPLSSGGMAHVELAVGIEAGNFKKLMVLKTIREELAFDPDIVAMFLSEARLSARLNHANLVQVYEVMEYPRPRIVMEYLEGLSLTEIQRAVGDEGLDTFVQLRILSDVLAGLHYAHELCDYDGTPLGMVHRDVSPQNVVVTSDGRVKVLDFGIAKIANSPSYTQAGMVKGKMSYMSPEQLAGESLDRRTDVFAVGCMLWRAAAGKKLWAKASTEDIMRALVNGEIPSPSLHRAVDPQLEEIVMCATAPNRKHRYESAAALRAALDDYLAQALPLGCDLREWMESTFAEHWAQQRESVRKRLVDATSMPPLPVSSVAPVELDRVTYVPTATVPISRKTRLITVGIVAAAVSIMLLGAVSLIGLVEPSASARGEPLVNTPSAQAERVLLRIKAEPAGAQISVDGKLTDGNPAVVQVSAGDEHLVEVAQQGYGSLMRRFRVERETSLELALMPETAKAAPASVAAVAHSPLQGRKVAAAAPSAAPSVEPAASDAPDTPNVAAAPAQREDACAVPFYFKDGIKSYKPECL